MCKDVMFFQAVDGDSGRNGEINYKITSGDVSLFAMDEQTGDLELLRPINLENNQYESQYFLEITSYNVLPYSVPTYTNHTATVTINIQVTLHPKCRMIHCSRIRILRKQKIIGNVTYLSALCVNFLMCNGLIS